MEAIHECTAPDVPSVVFEFETLSWFIPELQAKKYYDRIQKCLSDAPGNNPFSRRGIHQMILPTDKGPVTLKT